MSFLVAPTTSLLHSSHCTVLLQTMPVKPLVGGEIKAPSRGKTIMMSQERYRGSIAAVSALLLSTFEFLTLVVLVTRNTKLFYKTTRLECMSVRFP